MGGKKILIRGILSWYKCMQQTKGGVADLGGYLGMFFCLFPCLSVCMNTHIFTIIMPRDNKFNMNITIYHKKLQMFSSNGGHAHYSRKSKIQLFNFDLYFIFWFINEKERVQLWNYNIIY